MKSLSLTQPHIIALIGVPGSGKSFFAEKFTETFHAPYVDYHKILELSGASIDIAKRLYQYQLHELLKTNQSIIVEGLADSRVDRIALQKKARLAGYRVLLVWVQIDPATAKNRSLKQAKSDHNHTMTSDEYDRIAKRFTPPNTSENAIVVSGKHTYASQAKVVLKRLSQPRAAISSHDTPPVRPERTVQTERRNITIR